MRGTGKTVFSGDRVDEFQVKILGVLENVGPRQSIILARLSGGPLAETGVIQGMSGSPVYVDGKLLGAVALAFTFSKEAIAGIRPIEEMLEANPVAPRASPPAAIAGTLPAGLSAPPEILAGDARLVEIATPVSFSGFTQAAIDHFAPQLRAVGLSPRQGMSGGGRPGDRLGNPAKLQPGSMISVQLLSGDMSVGADGTVTYIDGNRVYAFGHRFLAVGRTDLPFASAEVLALLPNVSSSFKISAAREWMGTITDDSSTAVSGLLGRRAELAPVSIRVRGAAVKTPQSYRMEMVNDRVLSPLLLQMAVFCALDATQRSLGSASFNVRGRIEFEGNLAPLALDNTYSGDVSVPALASLGASLPLTYVLQSGFESLKVKSATFTIDASDRRKQLQIDQVWTSAREVRPGEAVDVMVGLMGDNGAESTHKVNYRVPVGAPLGPLYFTVADATTTNLTELQQKIGVPLRSPAQAIALVNSLRSNTKAYVRVWRTEPGYQVQGQDLPDPPPSVAMILARAQAASGTPFNWRGSKVAELEISGGDSVITGSKTVLVEVKE